jgi:hypothetical protein
MAEYVGGCPLQDVVQLLCYVDRCLSFLAIILSAHRLTASEYLFGIFRIIVNSIFLSDYKNLK